MEGKSQKAISEDFDINWVEDESEKDNEGRNREELSEGLGAQLLNYAVWRCRDMSGGVKQTTYSKGRGPFQRYTRLPDFDYLGTDLSQKSSHITAPSRHLSFGLTSTPLLGSLRLTVFSVTAPQGCYLPGPFVLLHAPHSTRQICGCVLFVHSSQSGGRGRKRNLTFEAQVRVDLEEHEA